MYSMYMSTISLDCFLLAVKTMFYYCMNMRLEPISTNVAVCLTGTQGNCQKTGL